MAWLLLQSPSGWDHMPVDWKRLQSLAIGCRGLEGGVEGVEWCVAGVEQGGKVDWEAGRSGSGRGQVWKQ